jgi:CDP-paratose 2-epimerase
MSSAVLITGGAGFAGSAIALAIKRDQPERPVIALDNLRRRGSELNLPALAAAGVQFVHGDIRNPEDLAGLSPGVIIECSAEPSVMAGYNGSPEYLIGTNLTGCAHCLELARRCRSDFIFVSTSRVYPFRTLNALAFRESATRFELCSEQRLPGASDRGISEEFPLEGPRSLYGMTKLAAELMVEEYADAYGLRYLVNRCGLLAGPRQMGKVDQGVISLWVLAHHYGRPLNYIGFRGTGKQVRDFLHIDDFCDLVLDQMRSFDLYANRRFNVGGGVEFSLSLSEMTDLCRQVTRRCVPVEASVSERPADVRIYITDHSRITAVNGWQPRRDARTLIEDIEAWLASEGDRLRQVLLAQFG